MTKSDEPTGQKPSSWRARFGFLMGQFKVPDDFDTMFQTEIEEMFHGSPIEPRTKGEGPTPKEPPRKP